MGTIISAFEGAPVAPPKNGKTGDATAASETGGTEEGGSNGDSHGSVDTDRHSATAPSAPAAPTETETRHAAGSAVERSGRVSRDEPDDEDELDYEEGDDDDDDDGGGYDARMRAKIMAKHGKAPREAAPPPEPATKLITREDRIEASRAEARKLAEQMRKDRERASEAETQSAAAAAPAASGTSARSEAQRFLEEQAKRLVGTRLV